MNLTIDRFPFETLDDQREHARELNRIRREEELRKFRTLAQVTTRIIRRAKPV